MRHTCLPDDLGSNRRENPRADFVVGMRSGRSRAAVTYYAHNALRAGPHRHGVLIVVVRVQSTAFRHPSKLERQITRWTVNRGHELLKTLWQLIASFQDTMSPSSMFREARKLSNPRGSRATNGRRFLGAVGTW